jgi:sugar phosphate isomerase/epimerase
MKPPLPWPLAAVLPDDPALFRAAVLRATALGFTHVEAAALASRPGDHLEALAEAGVVVAAAALSGDACTGSLAERRAALARLERQVADAALLGAGCVLLAPPPGAGEAAFADLCALLAEHAARRMVRLALWPREGAWPADGRAALGWLERAGGSNVGLLVDNEDAELVREAGGRLFHVRLRGRAVPPPLAAALAEVIYRGALGVEGWEGATQSPQTSSSTSSAT